MFTVDGTLTAYPMHVGDNDKHIQSTVDEPSTVDIGKS